MAVKEIRDPPSNNAGFSDDALESFLTEDGDFGKTFGPGAANGSEKSQVVKTAISYARENYAEATIALQSALKVSEPNSISFRFAILHIAQILKAANELEASLDCMLVRFALRYATPVKFQYLSCFW
ncbi:unnamed protein product [Phytophthora fragariaefolia]|uniref:Unnamed protein product n=1 Tax=Phytophthora fragariaefolia TaxID=1490495 RepID=A0A9W6XQ99_9STRA|nr:unnamed protein product [Phytophthora fragariaefolia]